MTLFMATQPAAAARRAPPACASGKARALANHLSGIAEFASDSRAAREKCGKSLERLDKEANSRGAREHIFYRPARRQDRRANDAGFRKDSGWIPEEASK